MAAAQAAQLMSQGTQQVRGGRERGHIGCVGGPHGESDGRVGGPKRDVGCVVD